MAGITSGVYDIFHPTPVPLKELSAIAVSLEVWRFKVKEYRNNRNLKEFGPWRERYLMKALLPDLPSMIYAMIDKYIGRFRSLFEKWLDDHHSRIFYFYYDHKKSVLKYFRDFVCDYNGVIHYERTAKRMMHCDRFDENQKFAIACTYCFEDDIRRIWPLVSGNMDLNNIDFSERPYLYYWISYLTNKLYKVPTSRFDRSAEEVMVYEYMPHNRPSIEYFWNRLPMKKRMRKAVDIFMRDVVSFVRFILPKFDDQQLKEFVNGRCFRLIRSLCKKASYDEELILSTWLFVKNAINVDGFANLVHNMLLKEMKGVNPTYWSQLCCEIWNNAADEFKHSAVTVNTSIDNRFSEDLKKFAYKITAKTNDFNFLFSFLSFANNEERRRFWFNCWNNLFERVGVKCKAMQKIMNLCFENEDEMVEFKENVMTNSESVRFFCGLLLDWSRFDELNDYASLLFFKVQAARNFKQRLLRENFLDGDGDIFFLTSASVVPVKEFNQFIDDAFGDADLSANFKNQLMSLPKTQERLSRNVLRVPSEQMIEFIDAFVSAEDTLLQIKTRMIDELKENAADNESVLHDSSFTSLLSWCLGNNEEFDKFMSNYSY